MDKQALRQAIHFALENELTLIAEAANTARDEATNEESRAEDRFDMRSQSAAYLAAGQAKLAGELQAAIAAYRSMPLRALVSGPSKLAMLKSSCANTSAMCCMT